MVGTGNSDLLCISELAAAELCRKSLGNHVIDGNDTARSFWRQALPRVIGLMDNHWPKLSHCMPCKKLACRTYQSCCLAHARYAPPSCYTFRHFIQVPVVMQGCNNSCVNIGICRQLPGQATHVSRNSPVLLQQENLGIKRNSHGLVWFGLCQHVLVRFPA